MVSIARTYFLHFLHISILLRLFVRSSYIVIIYASADGHLKPIENYWIIIFIYHCVKELDEGERCSNSGHQRIWIPG